MECEQPQTAPLPTILGFAFQFRSTPYYFTNITGSAGRGGGGAERLRLEKIKQLDNDLRDKR